MQNEHKEGARGGDLTLPKKNAAANNNGTKSGR